MQFNRLLKLVDLDSSAARRWGYLLCLVSIAAVGLATLGFDHPWTVPLLTALVGLALGVAIGAATKRASDWRAPSPDLLPQPGDSQSAPPEHDVRSVIEILDEPAFVLDGKTRVQVHNRRANDLFPSLRVGQGLAQVSRHPVLLETIQLAQADGLSRSVQIIDRMPYGRRVLVSVAALDRVQAAGTSPRLLVQFRDLSEQDRLTQMRSDFIANASHELRTPLASLKGFIETLQGPASGDAAARERFLAIMEAQAARMARILDDLLSLSRIEMRAHVPPAGEVDLALIVREALQGLEPIAHDAGITLQCEAMNERFRVKGDRDELVQVLQNLIQNAIKYGRSGGKVDVSLRREGAGERRPGRVIVAVADDGPGIAEEHLPRLTERFYRVDTVTSREKGGTGLGLAIVKHILNRHRGELKVVSAPGKGSTFSMVLDALADPAKP